MSCPFPTDWAGLSAALRDAAGSPGEGPHRVRIGPFALVDLALTVVVAVIVWYLWAPRCWSYGWFVVALVLLLALTVPVHMAFGVETAGVRLARQWFGAGAPAPRLSSGRVVSTHRAARVGSYPLAADYWRAAPMREEAQDFSDV